MEQNLLIRDVINMEHRPWSVNRTLSTAAFSALAGESLSLVPA
jgi:hypothetical protein